MACADLLNIEVAYSPAAGRVQRWALLLPAGSLVQHALTSSGLFLAYPELRLDDVSVGVWGAPRAINHPLRDGDRVEIYRPLRVDPKEARRLRHRSQRAGQGKRGKEAKKANEGRDAEPER